jgi:hypothetical protein
MMKNIIILLLLFLSNMISAQKTEIDSIISHEIKNLKENKISDFFIIEKSCNGCIKLINVNEQDCNYGTSKLFIFWKEKDATYFRNIDKCNSSKIRISNDIFNNFSAKTIRMKKETIKPYQTNKNSYVSSSHSTFSEFYFVIGNKIERKIYDHFNLTNEKEKPNINFIYNNSLSIIKLAKVCDEIINRNQ